MLKEMEFVACHGACPHEYELDQKFKVNVELHTDCIQQAGASDELSLTINYAQVFQLVEEIMHGEHVDLIETLAYRIGHQVIKSFQGINEIKVQVYKLHPPIPNFNGIVSVELEIKREEVDR